MLVGANSNFILGQWGGYRGVVYSNGAWATSSTVDAAATSWAVTCASFVNSTSATVYLNGADVTYRGGGQNYGSSPPGSLAVNTAWTRSTFGFRALAVWNVALSPSQLFAVSTQMMADSCIAGAWKCERRLLLLLRAPHRFLSARPTPALHPPLRRRAARTAATAAAGAAGPPQPAAAAAVAAAPARARQLRRGRRRRLRGPRLLL